MNLEKSKRPLRVNLPLEFSSNHRARIDGSTFERLVLDLLTEAGCDLPNFCIEHQELIRGAEGQYRIDITIRFRQLGVDFLILVECKDHTRPVEREDVQVLFDKMRSSGAQKAILFATNGFQKGALEYAKAHGIALVRILEGELTYETRSADYLGVRRSPPPWANIQPFVGQLIFIKDNVIHVSLIEHGHPGPLKSYLSSGQAKPL